MSSMLIFHEQLHDDGSSEDVTIQVLAELTHIELDQIASIDVLMAWEEWWAEKN